LFKYFPNLSFMSLAPIPLSTNKIWSYLFVYNLPHGLWCLSGLMIIRAILFTNIKWRTIYACIFLVVISALEISQISEHRNGTFDVLDLASYVIFAFVESTVYNIIITTNSNHHELFV
jgi:hypothetical protein